MGNSTSNIDVDIVGLPGLPKLQKSIKIYFNPNSIRYEVDMFEQVHPTLKFKSWSIHKKMNLSCCQMEAIDQFVGNSFRGGLKQGTVITFAKQMRTKDKDWRVVYKNGMNEVSARAWIKGHGSARVLRGLWTKWYVEVTVHAHVEIEYMVHGYPEKDSLYWQFIMVLAALALELRKLVPFLVGLVVGIVIGPFCIVLNAAGPNWPHHKK